jgi:threonine synthase
MPDQSATPRFVDRSGATYDITAPRWRGDDGSPLMTTELPGLTAELIDGSQRSLWRYGAAIPVQRESRITLGEGFTPQLPMRWRERQVQFKLEWFNPTSSFKDRGSSVMISHLSSLGVTAVLEDSSGNGGSSVAAYCSAGGMQAKIIAPASTSAPKILQSRAFGAEVELVSGTRDEVAAEAVRQSAERFYASHNWHPFFLQGTKTLGYEIWEMLGFRAPDNVVTVAGAGSIVLGCDIAFTELLASGAITHRPRLLVGQPEDFSPIVGGVNAGTSASMSDGSAAGGRRPTIAEGAAIASPPRLPELVDAITRSGGAAVAISEVEIHQALRAITARGLYAEPTSAVAVAALDRFIDDGTIGSDETTVVILTGSSVKTADKTATVFG